MSVQARETCRLCGQRSLTRVVELTPTPPGNHFRRKEDLDEPQKTYPLELHFCDRCAHVQLGHVVDAEILYQRNYSYVSATSPVFVTHLKEYVSQVRSRLGLSKKRLVADIGSNDGTCLRFFRDVGHPVLGVDPAKNIAEKATAAGIPTWGEFFTAEVGRRAREEHGPAQLITSHNACAHIDNLDDVIRGVAEWLALDGYFVMEVGYLLDVYDNCWFDTVYHEHVDFHSLAPLIPFFARHGLEVFRVERVAPQGGSIRVFTQREEGTQKRDDSVDALVEREKARGLHQADTFRAFEDKINSVRDDLSELVRELKSQGKSIAGYGAPTKATTLLSHFKLGDVLDFIVDDNPLKQGLYSPLHHIPVIHPSEVYTRRPDFLLVLAWNFAESIMAKHQRFADEGGKFILPMPRAQLVD